jgi:hypothetical protein
MVAEAGGYAGGGGVLSSRIDHVARTLPPALYMVPPSVSHWTWNECSPAGMPR